MSSAHRRAARIDEQPGLAGAHTHLSQRQESVPERLLAEQHTRKAVAVIARGAAAGASRSFLCQKRRTNAAVADEQQPRRRSIAHGREAVVAPRALAATVAVPVRTPVAAGTAEQRQRGARAHALCVRARHGHNLGGRTAEVANTDQLSC